MIKVTVKSGETHTLEGTFGFPAMKAETKRQEGYARACRASQIKALLGADISYILKNSIFNIYDISPEVGEILKQRALILLKPITNPHKWIETDLISKAIKTAFVGWLYENKLIDLYA